MMKKILLCFAAFIMLFFSSCDNNVNNHEHSYVDGVCSCGELDPNYHEHAFIDGKCSCGEIDPDYHFHSYENGKCECGEKDPNHTHEFIEGKCVCGETDPNYHVHNYIDGVCSCGEIDPNKIVKYTIKFDPLFSDSTIIVYINEGELVEALIPDLIEGYNFIGWNQDYSFLNSDLEVHANFEVIINKGCNKNTFINLSLLVLALYLFRRKNLLK